MVRLAITNRRAGATGRDGTHFVAHDNGVRGVQRRGRHRRWQRVTTQNGQPDRLVTVWWRALSSGADEWILVTERWISAAGDVSPRLGWASTGDKDPRRESSVWRWARWASWVGSYWD
jgi:hypothetical protein